MKPPPMSRHWFVLLAAVLLFYEGIKTMFQWNTGVPPAPWFGAVVSEGAWPVVSIVHGLIECAIGALLLYENRWAGTVAIPYYAVLMLNTYVSWDLWGAWMTELLTRRGNMNQHAIEGWAANAPKTILVGQVVYFLLSVVGWAVGQQQRRKRAAATASPAPDRSPSL